MIAGYKVVAVLKNGARVSIFAPQELGLRKTYHANGKALKVDSGMVFQDFPSAKAFVTHHAWYVPKTTKIEIWECDYKLGLGPLVKVEAIAAWKSNWNVTKKNILAIFKRLRKTHRVLPEDYEHVAHAKSWPYGTICAADIVLTQKIEERLGLSRE